MFVGASLAMLTLMSAVSGFVLLALSQRIHRPLLLVLPRLAARQAAFRPVGICLLVVSLVLAVQRDGVAFGIVVWALLIAVAAFVAALVVNVLRRHFRRSRKVISRW